LIPALANTMSSRPQCATVVSPEVFLEVRRNDTSGYPTPPKIDDAWEEMRHDGDGVRCFVTDDQPRREWPLARKQKVRRRNPWHRLMKRYALFAADWYAERLAAKPDSYGVPSLGELDGLRIRSQQEHVAQPAWLCSSKNRRENMLC
jgi:hypothetical protein